MDLRIPWDEKNHHFSLTTHLGIQVKNPFIRALFSCGGDGSLDFPNKDVIPEKLKKSQENALNLEP